MIRVYHCINFLNLITAAKFDVAISTACGGLDYIVVETTNAAQACVELLRRENLGVATFMILVFILWVILTFVLSAHVKAFKTRKFVLEK
jgi:nitrate reductase NapE component